MACPVFCRSCYDGDPSHKKDSLWSWMVCVAAATNLAFSIGLLYSFGVLLPVLMDYFKENRERTAWIGSLSFGVSLACGPFVGSLVNRFGCRKVSITGCLTGALSLTIASFAIINGLAVLYVCYAVFGAGACSVYLSGLAMVRKCFDKRRSIAVGIASAGLGLGTMSLSQVLQFLVTVLSWRNSLRIVAGGLALNSFSGLLYDSTIVETANDSEPLSIEEDGQRRRSKQFMFHFSVWRVPGFLVLTFSFMILYFGRTIVYVHLVKFCEDRGMTFSASSRLILFMGIQLVVGRFACGFLCSFKRLDNWYIYQALLLVNGVSTMLLTLAQNYEAFVAYAVVFGFCDGAWNTVNTIQALACVDSSRAASAFGFMLLAGSVTSLIGPPISGLAADKLGSYGPSFHMAGGTFLVASSIPCVLRCIKTKKTIGEENTEQAEDHQEQSEHNVVRMDGSLTRMHNSNGAKSNSDDNILFISTI